MTDAQTTSDSLRIAVVQLQASPLPRENLAKIEARLAPLRDQACHLIVLPENCLCLGHGATVRAAARQVGQWLDDCRALAARAGCAVLFGGVPVQHQGSVRNSALLLASDGRLLGRYDKIHLFQLDPGLPGGVDETHVYERGTQPVSVELRGWRVALSICYDLRFPELYRACGDVDLVLCTAAFTAATGQAHWEPLLRARAIENLAYVAGANQSGANPETQLALHGSSLIADPWGEVIAAATPESEETLVCTLRKDRIAEVRKRLPALRNRYPGLGAAAGPAPGEAL